MDSIFGDKLDPVGITKGLRNDRCGVGWSSNVISSSHFALVSAYDDISARLADLEWENSSIKRKLKVYERKFPVMSWISEDRKSCCSVETHETVPLQSRNSSLQLQFNTLMHELQKSRAREERLEEVIQAYKKLHVEKGGLQRDLDKMTTLVEEHVERIHGLESAVRQKDNSLLELDSQLHEQIERGPFSLDAHTKIRLRTLELELEEARQEAHGSCIREEELKAKCKRLQEELRQLQDTQQEMVGASDQSEVGWMKTTGHEQVNLMLAYNELSEELTRLCSQSARQATILSKMPLKQTSPVQPHSPALQYRYPDTVRLSPLARTNEGPASYCCHVPSHMLRASFQCRRSYSEVADPSTYQCLPHFTQKPKAKLDKLGSPRQQPTSVPGSPQHNQDLPLPLLDMHNPQPTIPPLQSSEDETEWACPSSGASGIQGPASCSMLSPPTGLRADQAQAWSSINLWMDMEENEIQSCPLCQRTFPRGYSEDALIKHIDTHLEYSKI